MFFLVFLPKYPKRPPEKALAKWAPKADAEE
jgi:hypothetical protein